MKRGHGKGTRNVIIIMLILLTVLTGAVLISLIPHNTELGSLYILDTKPPQFKYLSAKDYDNDDHAYHYYANNGIGKIYIDSDTDLEMILDDNDDAYEDCLGEQKLRLRLTGIRYFTEDMMGIFVKYPVLVYEYQA